LFVEVKNVLYVEDISDYLTNKKINTLKKTIDTFLWKNNFDKKVRLDVVFVKNDRILRVFDNVFI
jgi:Holliday junction resolvase-like predicted endonuclease